MVIEYLFGQLETAACKYGMWNEMELTAVLVHSRSFIRNQVKSIDLCFT